MARTKKEIDKDLMYKKLMPSAVKTKLTAQEESEEAAVPNAQVPEEAVQTQEPLNQHPPVLRREIGVPFMDAQQTVLVNAMESVVLEKLESVLSRFKCCKCDRCKKDIVALALNKLPSKYKVLREGNPVPDLDPQTNVQVVTALIQAVLAVRDHPRH